MPDIKLASRATTTHLSDGRWASVCTKDYLFLLEKCQKKHTAQIFRSYLIIGFFSITHLISIYTHKNKIKKKSVYGVHNEVEVENVHMAAFLHLHKSFCSPLAANELFRIAWYRFLHRYLRQFEKCGPLVSRDNCILLLCNINAEFWTV